MPFVKTPPHLAVKMARNAPLVDELKQAINQVEYFFKLPAESLKLAIADGALRAFLVETRDEPRVVRPASFRDFIEAPEPDGCGTTVELFRRAVKGTDVADAFESMLAGEALSDVDPNSLHIGLLANNATTVMCMRSSLNGAAKRLDRVPPAVRAVIDAEAWKAFPVGLGRPVFHNDFRRFMETKLPEGCGVDVEILRKAVAGSDVAAEVERLLQV